jgi:hypothetical protein
MNEKPIYCTKKDITDCCLCELSADGVALVQ